MSTPRKNWFKVPDSIAFDAMSNDQLATLIRLQGYMNTRWARDGKRAEDRGTVSLNSRMVMTLTGKGRRDVAVTLLRSLADVSSMSVRCLGDVVEIGWPKYAEFQCSPSRESPPPISKPSPSQSPRKKISEGEAAPRPARAPSKTPCPDDLSPSEAGSVRAWVDAKGIEVDIASEWEAHRDHWRSRRELRADWVASFRTWLRNAQRFAERDRQRLLLPSPAQAKADRTKDAARRAYELLQQRKLGLIEGGAA